MSDFRQISDIYVAKTKHKFLILVPIFFLHYQKQSTPAAYIIVSVGQIQRRLVFHVSQHFVCTELAEEVGDLRVLSAYGEVQRRAAVKHGSVHVGPLL